MISRWSHEGLKESAQIRRGYWDREAALGWIADRREDGTVTAASSSDLLQARLELYRAQGRGQNIRNDLAEATVVYRKRAEQGMSDATAEQIAAGDAWARDASTPAAKPLQKLGLTAAQVLALKSELWNEHREAQSRAVQRVIDALAVGEDVGASRIRISGSLG